jgi:hypothetical protein
LIGTCPCIAAAARRARPTGPAADLASVVQAARRGEINADTSGAAAAAIATDAVYGEIVVDGATGAAAAADPALDLAGVRVRPASAEGERRITTSPAAAGVAVVMSKGTGLTRSTVVAGQARVVVIKKCAQGGLPVQKSGRLLQAAKELREPCSRSRAGSRINARTQFDSFVMRVGSSTFTLFR